MRKGKGKEMIILVNLCGTENLCCLFCSTRAQKLLHLFLLISYTFNNKFEN